MPERYIIAYDLGTSGNKALLYSQSGRLVASETVLYETRYPEKHFAEQNPLDWWDSVCVATKTLLSDTDPSLISAVAVTGHMLGLVAVDSDGQPLGASLIWLDNRAREEEAELNQKLGKNRVNRITGQQLSACYTLPKVMWLKKHQPQIYAQLYRVLQAKDFINFRLTGKFATDVTDATYTLAYDIEKRLWSDEMLRAADIPASIFPTVYPSDAMLGRITEKAAAECGLPAGIPVMAGAGDGSAAHIGAACVENGDTYICIGTSTWIMTQLDRLIFDPAGMTQTEPHVISGSYVLGGTMQTGGESYRWLHDQLLGGAFSYQALSEMAAHAEPGGGGVMFLPYLFGERSPWWDNTLNATLLGLRLETTQADIVRAVIEGVVHNLRILLDITRRYTEVKNLVMIGGCARNDIWCQIASDILDVPVFRPDDSGAGTGRGAAVIAGIGAGLLKDYTLARQFLGKGQHFTPNPKLRSLYDQRQKIFIDAHDALLKIDHQLAPFITR